MLNTSSSIVAIIEEAPAQGLFELTFSNSKTHGMHPLQTHHCQGVLYDSGHVHLDTQYIQVTQFASLSQMCEYLDQFGYFKVNWQEET
ncbi:MAG: hypothetical protein AUF65_00830 [Chloroflexi bacterium 13_1_20CM_50_12]|nr:MAG: hypothetical protein AUF65_00830 [Chloroflexi bacterium 13_1_20CM_50_12]